MIDDQREYIISPKISVTFLAYLSDFPRTPEI